MPINLSHLEQKIRRSSAFRTMTDLQDYLEYASHCKDELEVYFYMQENNIHTGQPRFWLAFLNVLRLKCQFKQIIKKLLQIKKNLTIREHHEYYRILQFEDSLTRELQMDIRKRKGKKRRSLQEFELFSISKIQKKKRKVGGIQIYVDEDCRDNYKLEDYSEFFINNMKDEVQARRHQYERKQANKPLSFLGTHESNIQKWSFQLIDLKKLNALVDGQQKGNNGRESSLFRNNDGQSNVHNRRFSVSRRSNVNLGNDNNPEVGLKTPKESIYITTTPLKNKCSQTFNNKDHQAATPTVMSKHLINDRSLLKACRKNEKHERKFRYQSPTESSEELQKLFNKQLFQTKDDYFDDQDNSPFNKNYPQHKQVIRLDFNQVQSSIIITNGYEFPKAKDIFDKKEDRLDLGCVEWSLVEDEKVMDVESEIDKQLKETIFMAQLDKFQTQCKEQCKSFNFDDSIPQFSMNCEENFSLDSSNSELQDSSIGVVMCLKSTQTLESIDSNQQNLFSIHKPMSNSQSSHHLQAFKKERKLFQVISIQDKTFIANDSNESADLQIQKVNEGEMMSLQGNDEIQQMIDEMDAGQNDHHKNLVLETLRKKKYCEILMNQIREDEKQHNCGTHSQKKSTLSNGLKYISQEKSYNSERRYNSRQRFSSGNFLEFS